MKARPLALSISALLLALALAASAALAGSGLAAAESGLGASGLGPRSLAGRFAILWLDAQPGAAPHEPVYTLTDDSGQVIYLSADHALSEAAAVALNGRSVVVRGAVDSPSQLRVDAIEPVGAAAALASGVASVSGAKPWINLLCKFSDVADEPKSPAYIQGMFGDAYPLLGNYWQQASYGVLSIAGTSVAGWVSMPQPRAYYQDSNSFGYDAARLFEDCTAAADAQVDFRPFYGINLMFNADLSTWASAANLYVTLEGQAQSFAVTWLWPWALGDLSLVAHEMGHGFGLHHSSDACGLDAGNPWDVMSNNWAGCINDPTYGCIPRGTVAPHRDMMGWMPSGARAVVGDSSSLNVTLQPLEGAPAAGDSKMVKIPIAGSPSHYYAVEARTQAGYDSGVPASGVLIYEVDETRWASARLVSAGSQCAGEDTVWRPGETFTDPIYGVQVTTLSTSGSGYTVRASQGISPISVADLAASIGLDGVRDEDGRFWYRFSAYNAGPGSADGVVLTATIPSEASFVQADRQVVSSAGQSYAFDLGTLLAGLTATVGIQVAGANDLPPGYQMQAQAAVAAVTSDPDLSNNSAHQWNAPPSKAPPGPATAGFAADQAVGRVPLTVQFTNLSVAAGSYLWSFGDGATSAAASPSHAYAAPGSYTVTLTVTGTNGSDTLAKFGYIQAYSFDDVFVAHPAWLAIEKVRAAGITAGCNAEGTLFCPDGLVKREEIAVFIARAMGWAPTPGANLFGDLAANHWATPWAETLRTRGVTAGCQAAGESLRFCPSAVLSRAEIAAMIRAAAGWAPASPVRGVFADVAPDSWAAPHVEAFFAHAPAAACGWDAASGKPLFCPDAAVTRAYMAALLVSMFGL